MPKRFIFMGIFVLIIAASAWALADSWQKKHKSDAFNQENKEIATAVLSDSPKISIIASLFPWYDLSKQIGGQRVEVKLLLAPGIEAHSFEPTPSDMINIGKSQLFLYTGDYMEPWAQDILDGLDTAAPQSLALGADLASISNNAEDKGLDPHIWLNPMLMSKAAGRLAQALAKIDPTNKAYYNQRLENYNRILEDLDAAYQTTLSKCKQKDFIYAGHYTFAYLADRYNLNYQAAQGFSPDAESSPQKIADLLKTLKTDKAAYIFAEELDNPQLAESLAKDAGVKILILNSAHNVSKDDIKSGLTYEQIMKNNLKQLSLGLKCQ